VTHDSRAGLGPLRLLALLAVLGLAAAPAATQADPASDTSLAALRAQSWSSATAANTMRFDIDVATLKSTCAAAIADAKSRIDALVRARSARTFQSVVVPLEAVNGDVNDETVVDTNLAFVSTDAKIREASFACQNDLGALFNAEQARPDLYAAVASAKASGTAKTRADKKLTDLWLIALKRSGAGLPAAGRKQFVALGDELQKLQNDYAANLAADKTSITLTKAQLAGLPDDFVATFDRKGDDYVVRVNESTYERFMQNASEPSARKAYYLADSSIGYPANTKLLQQAIAVRDKLAHLMGYSNWASYVLADRMAQTPLRVDSFLGQLDKKLFPRAEADLATLATLKGAPLDQWDVVYYDNQLNKTKYAVDNHAVAQYFPVEHVERAVFDIYSKILGVTFAPRSNPNLWSPDVTEWTMTDTASGKYIGEFYLDLFPRDGKYTHVANFGFLPNRRMPDGSVRPPLSAIIGNWPKPAPGHPAVISHGDVTTFFHEFGHDMATLLATTPYETLSSGFRQDFVEAPSQMLENWTWDPAILKLLSSNAETGAPLPDDMIAKMRAARYVDNAYFTTRQIMLATVDMKYHELGAKVDTNAVWAQVAKTVSPMPLLPGAHPESNFGHIMGGYDAGYYGYLWSKVYAQDMFTAFQAGGLESPVVGARYRADILQPGREVEPDPEVRAFLGRPMNPDAFYKEFDQEGKPSGT